MAAPHDAAGLADLVIRYGLADPAAVREQLAAQPARTAPAGEFAKVLERRRLVTPFQTAKLLKGDADGYAVGGYRLLYRVASGSFGRVYRGDDPRTGRTVAVKILRKRWADDPKRVAMFEKEGRQGMAMKHPNVVQMLAFGRDIPTDSYYIVMEFVEGGNLRDMLTFRRTFPPADALRLMAGCAAGLAYAYSRGRTHRDIKPTNILIATDGTAKLVDFGMADLGDGGDPDQPPERTIEYAGLEKATRVKAGDVRSDIYFLGHVLAEMVFGEPLMARTRDHKAATDPARFRGVEAALARRAVGLPDPLRRVLTKAVAFDPGQRYQTPDQFLAAVRSAWADLDPAGADPGDPDPSPPAAAVEVQPTSGVFAAIMEDLLADRGGHRLSSRAVRPVPAGPAAAAPPTPAAGPLTIVLVEPNAKLRAALHDRLRRVGFRVLVEDDLAHAVDHYDLAPYHALLVDAGTVPEVTDFAGVLAKADRANHRFAGVVLANENQADLRQWFQADPRVAVMVRPVTMRQLTDQLRVMIPEMPPPEPASGSNAIAVDAATRPAPPADPPPAAPG